MIKIVAVCGFGIGTSVILRMSIQKALEKMNIVGEVECSDMMTATGMPCDVYLTSSYIRKELATKVSQSVVEINDFLSVDEITQKIQDFLNTTEKDRIDV